MTYWCGSTSIIVAPSSGRMYDFGFDLLISSCLAPSRGSCGRQCDGERIARSLHRRPNVASIFWKQCDPAHTMISQPGGIFGNGPTLIGRERCTKFGLDWLWQPKAYPADSGSSICSGSVNVARLALLRGLSRLMMSTKKLDESTARQCARPSCRRRAGHAGSLSEPDRICGRR